MRRDVAEAGPLTIGFADLFDHLGTDELRYSATADKLSGRAVAIEGYLSHAHGPNPAMMLVDQPGLCPDCSPVPAAVITITGSPAFLSVAEDEPVKVVGLLDYGFRIDAGVATFMRIAKATVFPVETRS